MRLNIGWARPSVATHSTPHAAWRVFARLTCLALAVFLSMAAPTHAHDEIHMGFLYSTRPELNRSDTRTAFDLWTQEFMAKQKIVFKGS
jgi:hypothetical protein